MLVKGKRSWVRTLISAIIVAAIFFSMGRSLYRSWGQVRQQVSTLHFHWLVLVLPFLCFAVCFAISAYGWKRVLRQFGEQVSFRKAVQIIAYSLFGKYLPGKVWAALGRMYLAKEAGVQERHAALSIIVETAYQLVSALALFVFSLFFYPGLLARTYLLLLLIPVTLVMLVPPVFNRLVNFMLRFLKQKPVAYQTSLGQALVIFLLYLAAWLVQGVGLYLLVLSIRPIGIKALLILPGAFSLSWIVGFIVIFAPGGLGVREGLFAILLNPIVPGALNIIVSLLSRLWITVGEILVFVFVFVFARLRRNNVKQETTGTQA